MIKIGRWGGAPTIEERIFNRDMVQKFIKI